ncbi:MAG: amidohydrolase family protein [Gammaproteobacteria bacterium]|nr:amidohydrolase family protein [Gammaproteobacteria bacterium]
MSNNTDTSTIYDIKITGGTIVDGSGKPGYRGDVAIKDGKVVALGQAPGTAATTIDATDRMITPGFVDIHTHYDAQVLWDRMLTISPWHGVTTVVLGNCGFGVAPTRPEHRDLIIGTLEKVEGMSPAALNAGLGADWPFETFPQYLDAIEKAGTAINVGVLIGHTPTRLYVMGEAATEREATADEIEQMRKIVAEAMAAGAIGFATSKSATHVGLKGRPVPSRVASYEEVRTLVSTLKGGKGMMQATAGKELWFDEYEKLAEENDITISWTAMLAGMVSPDAHIKQQERTAELIAKGRNIVPQVTPRPLCFEFQFKEPFPFESLSVFKPVAAADAEGKKKYYADPEFRRLVKENWRVCAPRSAPPGKAPSSPCAAVRSTRSARSAKSRGNWASKPSTSASTWRSPPTWRRASGCRWPTPTKPWWRICSRIATPCSAFPTPAPMPASCATPVCPPICSAAGCATRKPSRSRKPSAC